MKRIVLFCAAAFVAYASLATAQEITVTAVECLPNEANATIMATVSPETRGSDEVRLYFRRLNPTGAFYWTEMNASSGTSYWTVLPRSEQREQPGLTDEWWEILQTRDWAEDRDREWLEDWMDEQDHEAAEYYVALVDVAGEEIARSQTQLVEVLDRDDCQVGLDPFQVGQSRNLTIGETTPAQYGNALFHWLCDGVVSRVNFEGILRGDEMCRACVVAGWVPAVPAGAALISGATIEKREPRRTSAVLPGN